ncbi:hypothetical protein [Pantoea vagans]|uniref:hypothetical protein n=1 Tax=Pantoea vagans TaxID=470934 RepID=UPI00117C7D38|nr:hypothetical protein [Pantoea vagans]
METKNKTQLNLTTQSPPPPPPPTIAQNNSITSPLHHPSDNKMCLEIILAFLFGIPYAAALNAAILNKSDLKLSLACVGVALAVVWIGYDLLKLSKKTKFHIFFTISAKAIPAVLALFAIKYG